MKDLTIHQNTYQTTPNPDKKRILLSGPNGLGTTNNKYYFTVFDLNGDEIIPSGPFETELHLKQNVAIFIQMCETEQFWVDESDLFPPKDQSVTDEKPEIE